MLTKSDCTDLVAQKLHSPFELIDFKITPLSGTQVGFTGQHYRLKCTIQHQNSTKILQYFMKKKLDSGTCEESAVIDDEFQTFENEAIILKFLCDHNPNVYWLPSLEKYWESLRLLVFEDLAERNFEMSKFELGAFDLPHCKCVLETLAEFHGFSLSYENNRRKLEPAYSLSADFTNFIDKANSNNHSYGRKWIKASLMTIEYLVSLTEDNHVIDKIINYMPQFCESMQPYKSTYSVISHGDLWGNNLMFKYENNIPIQCCLVDFQVTRYIPFTQDVLFFIYVNTSRKFRKLYLNELLNFYFETIRKVLHKRGLDDISRNLFDQLCQDRLKPVLILSLIYKSFLVIDRKVFSELMADKERANDVIFGDRLSVVKTHMNVNAHYREVLLEEVQELIDVFF